MRSAVLVVPFALSLVMLASADAGAEEPYFVRVGEISAPAASDVALVRTSMDAVLEPTRSRSAGTRRRFVVSASLLSCDERRCVVSATLRDERAGNVIAVVRGSATSDSPARREGLLKAAAEGAGRLVPRAVP